MNKFIRLFNTIRYLKPIQIYYRAFYCLRGKLGLRGMLSLSNCKVPEGRSVNLLESIDYVSKYNNGIFSCLNISHDFEGEIDWNFSKYGKLWTYNLTYFEYLSEENDINMIYDFIDNIGSVKDGMEPFPTSLRCVNWIKYISKFDAGSSVINDSIFRQYHSLLNSIEYHLLGNHLLENGFSLLFGAYYFCNDVLYEKAEQILVTELEEQILSDGAHFELSPMYHQLMLFRLLDCINLVKHNSYKEQKLLPLLEEKATKMIGWLKSVSYQSGDIPLFNDSSNKIAPTSSQLFGYAKRLGLHIQPVALGESGYRKVIREAYECILDVGNVGPTYIPGHAHADTFNFELQLNGRSFIVDTGLSTYQIGKRRSLERSTSAHNTIEVNNTNSSNVWGGFRVAERAHISELYEKKHFIKATHNGYKKKYNILHTREWNFHENKLVIKDTLDHHTDAVFRLHFHPNITEQEILSRINVHDFNFDIAEYEYAPEFNRLERALMLQVFFEKEISVEIFV